MNGSIEMIRVYTIKNCSYCEQAKTYLKDKLISFHEVDMSIGGDRELQDMKRLFKIKGLKMYPVIMKGNKILLSGFDKSEYDMLFGE